MKSDEQADSQHRPIMCIVGAVVKLEQVPFKKRFNFKRLTGRVSASLDTEIMKIPPQPGMNDSFIKLVQNNTQKLVELSTLQDCPRMLSHCYQHLFDNNHFSEHTLEASEELVSTIVENCKTVVQPGGEPGHEGEQHAGLEAPQESQWRHNKPD